MALYRHQVIWKSLTGLPEDVVTNTFHSQATDDAAAALFAQRVTEFFNAPQGTSTEAITDFFSHTIQASGTPHEIRTYDLADPEPRVPVNTQFFGRSASSAANSLPREVALAMSYQAAPLSGAVQARRRGRIFLGPWNTDAMDSPPPDEDARPEPLLITAIIEAAQFLILTAAAEWIVWSETAGTFAIVTEGWVDNAFDTQRRRGAAPSVRNAFTSVTP